MTTLIKKRPPIPFETIGVAIAFSPRLEAILCEAKRLSDIFKAKLVLIHVGKHSAKKEQELHQLVIKHNFRPHSYSTVWEDGHPVDTILEICKNNVVDLLIAGAVEKESVFKYYIGSVSREICRKAKCSVLMLIEPSIATTILKNIVVNGIDHPKTEHTINASVYFANAEGAKMITIVRESHTPVLTMGLAESSTKNEIDQVKKDLEKEGNKKIYETIENLDKGNLDIKVKSITGKSGYSISTFAKSIKADLLVINSTDTHLTILDRIFTHDIEYILADLPCNLLIVHSRINE